MGKCCVVHAAVAHVWLICCSHVLVLDGQGATAISSADYYGGSEGGAPRGASRSAADGIDYTAQELMSKLSVQVVSCCLLHARPLHTWTASFLVQQRGKWLQGTLNHQPRRSCMTTWLSICKMHQNSRHCILSSSLSGRSSGLAC